MCQQIAWRFATALKREAFSLYFRNRSENAENALIFAIRHPDAPDDGSGMEFRGSEC